MNADAIKQFLGSTQVQAAAGDLGAVTVESALAPTFTLRPLGSGGDGGGGGFDPGAWLGALVAPRLTIQTPLGPVTVQPYGDPPAFPWLGVVVAFGAASMLALAVYGLWSAER